MFPLALAQMGEEHTVRRVGGDKKTRAHLESLGLVSGASVQVVSVMGSNLIIRLKDTRLALAPDMAMKIEV